MANVPRSRATLGDVQPALPQVKAHIGRHEATSGGEVDLIWEQEAAGSNPAIPTRPSIPDGCGRLLRARREREPQ